ncbi:MAG: AtpZ/AtpI family protein [Clostridia bacterium]|nr:AtpZ/AtpI family protein [Clostridia bacterium]
MKKSQEILQIFKGITYIGQVGVSVITPVLVFAFAAYMLVIRKGGSEVFMIIAILFGLVVGFFSAKSFLGDLLRVTKPQEETEKKSVGFNKHI